VSYGYHGLLTPSVFGASAVAVPFAIAGIFLGLRINRHLGQRLFEVILSVLIGVMGGVLWLH
jgi:uncharacterized membrane protein YfcA